MIPKPLPILPPTAFSLPSPPPGGFALWEHGFRPFFLGASIWASAGVAVWALCFARVLPYPDSFDLFFWHRHEMIFGFASAVISGFLLTAPGAWTGRPMPRGGLLAGIFALWVLGRISMLVSACPGWIRLVLNALLPVVVALVAAVPVARERQWRNLALLTLPLALSFCAVAMHLPALGGWPSAAIWADDAGLLVILVLVSVMAGRVMPFFTARGLGLPPFPVSLLLDATAPGLLAVAGVLELLQAPGAWRLAFWAGAGIVAAARTVHWFRPGVLRTPLLWSLHGALAFIPVGCLLYAFYSRGWVMEAVARHAFSAGAIGLVCISMMSRVARGHTGRPLRVDGMTLAAIWLVLAGALLRVAGPLAWPSGYTALAGCSGSLWAAGFALWFPAHVRMLVRPAVPSAPR